MTISPFWLFAIAAALALLLGAWLVPRKRRSMIDFPTLVTAKDATTLVMMGVAQLVATLVALSALICIVALWVFTQLSPTTYDDAMAWIGRVRGMKDLLAQTELWFMGLVLAFGVLWLGAMTSIRLQRNEKKERDAFIEAEFDRFIEQARAGELERLPDTYEMAELARTVVSAREHLEGLRADKAALPHRIKELEETAERAERAYILQDFARRARPMPPTDYSLLLMPQARGWRERVGRALISRGTFNMLRSAQKALLVVSLLVSVPAALSLSASAVGASLAMREVSLEDLALRLAGNDSETRFIAATRSAPQRAAQPQQPTTEDEAFVHDMGRVFEQSLANALDRRLPVPATTQAGRGNPVAAARALEARRDVLAAAAERRPALTVEGARPSAPSPAAAHAFDPVHTAPNIANVVAFLERVVRPSSCLQQA